MVTASDWVEFAAKGVVFVLASVILFFGLEMLRVWRRIREIEREEEQGPQEDWR